MLPPTRTILELAREAGFDLVGIAPAESPADGDRFLQWLEAGRHGEMEYLARNGQRIQEPSSWLEGLRSGISVAIDGGKRDVRLKDGEGRVAAYAGFRDYHRIFEGRLKRLGRALEQQGFEGKLLRRGSDALPFLERSLAVRAGIGFLAKSSGVLSPKLGPMLLLGELLTSAELESSAPATGSCGTCTACIDACPTSAIVAPHEVDARRCLSYTTIELRGPIPREFRASQADWVFGCDLCLDCCPFQTKSFDPLRVSKQALDPDLQRTPLLDRYDLVGFLEIDEESWNRDFVGTAIRRATRNGLRRNAAIALGNLGHASAASSLRNALSEDDPGLISAAAWALSRLGKERSAIEAALRGAEDLSLREDLEQSLDEFSS